MLQDRISGLRRAGRTLAGRVEGVRGEYFVRLDLSSPPVSYCDCGRPRCRHAAAIAQAYYSRRFPVLDAGLAVDRFLASPQRGPLVATALGEDFLQALRLPPEDLLDVWALPEPERILRLDAALQAAADPLPLLLELLPFAAQGGPLQDLVLPHLARAAETPRPWLALSRLAAGAPARRLQELAPSPWPQDLRPALAAAIWQAAEGPSDALRALGAYAAHEVPDLAMPILGELSAVHPALLAPHLDAARRTGRLSRALAALSRRLDALEPAALPAAEEALLAYGATVPRIAAEVLVRRAARGGDSRALRAARRLALRAGTWKRLRPVALGLLRQRADGAIRETEVHLWDADLDAAVRCAAQCRSSPVPERLVGDALRRQDPARARQHYLRAQAIANRLGKGDGAIAARLERLEKGSETPRRN